MSFNPERRYDGLQEQMEKRGIDIVVYGSCENFQYLTGLVGPPLSVGSWRRATDLGTPLGNVFVGKDKGPILTLPKHYGDRRDKPQTWIKDVRELQDDINPYWGFHYGENYGELIKTVLADLDLKSHCKIALGNHVWGPVVSEIQKIAEDAVFHDGSKLLDSTRMTKDEGELDVMRRAASLTDQVMKNVFPKIREGITQGQIEQAVEFEAKSLGALDISFPPIVKFIKYGSEPAPTPITYPVDKGLTPDTSIAFDIGFVLEGYCSDFGRSFYFGSPDEEIKRGYAALHESILGAVDRIGRDATHANELFTIAKSYLDKQGFGKYLPDYLPDLLGHSIGIEVHERPWLTSAYHEELRENTVLALEPRLWNPGKYYVRVEDMVLLHGGKKKNEILTSFDRDLFVIN